ncbi:MAG: C39 family peptidase, partial [Armatimonadetes bacterium]|nr:C39 family peptidase [Armatimonadota bacterium]
MEIRAVNGGASTIWYEVGRMGSIPGGIKRYTSDSYGYIDIDTLMLYATWPQIEYRVTLYANTAGRTPTLRLMSLCYADTGTAISYSPLPGPGVTTSLPVPWRSQYWVPGIGGVICGPTSLTMAEDYYGCDLPTETVAADCYDSYNDMYGNWPFIAQAAAKHGFKAYTFRANGQQPLRDQFAAGNAVIMSMAYSAGELTNSPISST